MAAKKNELKEQKKKNVENASLYMFLFLFLFLFLFFHLYLLLFIKIRQYFFANRRTKSILSEVVLSIYTCVKPALSVCNSRDYNYCLPQVTSIIITDIPTIIAAI